MSRFLMIVFLVVLTEVVAVSQGEVLYNGIRLTDPWPPKDYVLTLDPPKAPYLASPPEVIPIDVGRQLFVDDFLVQDARGISRVFHQAEYHAQNPVLKPDKPWEQLGDHPTAMVFSDGVWYDAGERLFKMWYMGGYCARTCYATSKDGIHWDKPLLDVRPGTNIVHTAGRDSTSVILDLHETNPARRYKMFRTNNGESIVTKSVHFSPDGIHWTDIYTDDSARGDRTTVFYNPFRRVWVGSIRDSVQYDGAAEKLRVRRYHEDPDPAKIMIFSEDQLPLWIGADKLDPRRPELNVQPQLYNLDCMPYESLIVGLFDIWQGQPTDRPKPNYLALGFSRDGFHWDRPTHQAFIPVSEHKGDWNWGNVQSAGGGVPGGG